MGGMTGYHFAMKQRLDFRLVLDACKVQLHVTLRDAGCFAAAD